MCLLGPCVHIKVYQKHLRFSPRGATLLQSALDLFYAACCLHRKQKENRVELLTALAMGLSGLWGQLYTSVTQAEQPQEKQ